MSARVLVLAGPTGIGKTSLATSIARETDATLIGADSRQLYRELFIGTARPSPRALAGVRHRMIGVLTLSERFTAHRYATVAQHLVQMSGRRSRPVIIVGGTGLYIRAALGGLYDVPTDAAVRRRWEEKAEEMGLCRLHERLHEIDPSMAEQISKNDGRRITRALEVHELTGERPSELLGRDIRRHTVDWNFRYVVVDMDREKLYARINARVDKMIANGVLNETGWLLQAGYGPLLEQRKALGYARWAKVLRGSAPLDDVTVRIKRAHRRYAKRQLTWFRKAPEAKWADVTRKRDRSQLEASLADWLETD